MIAQFIFEVLCALGGVMLVVGLILTGKKISKNLVFFGIFLLLFGGVGMVIDKEKNKQPPIPITEEIIGKLSESQSASQSAPIKILKIPMPMTEKEIFGKLLHRPFRILHVQTDVDRRIVCILVNDLGDKYEVELKGYFEEFEKPNHE